MKVIYKYTLPEPFLHVQHPYVMLPVGAKILSVQQQRGRLVAWALVDENEKQTERRRIELVMTGCLLPSGDFRHISTIQLMDGDFVLHVFEENAASQLPGDPSREWKEGE